MKQIQGIKLTVYPNGEQKSLIKRTLGSQRWIWNHFLSCNLQNHLFTNKFVFYSRMCEALPVLKQKYEWLKEVPSQTLQQTLKDLDKALKSCFKSGFGFPKFKDRNLGYDSARFPQGFKILEDGVYLPKIGFLPCGFRREIGWESVKNVTLSFDPFRDRYFISICFEAEVEPLPETGRNIGLDMGSVRLFTDSNGDFVEALRENPVASRLLDRIKAEQRKFSDILRKAKNHVKGAGRQLRRKKKTLHVLHRKLADFARDILHKLSRKIIGENDLIVVEDLNIRGMIASASGTIEEPGSNVKQKSGLNRNLLSNRISMFFQFLAYKCLWYGKKLIRIDPKFTSQKCSVCGHVDKNNRQDQAHFHCQKCGNEMNADYNAAVNILNAGLNPVLLASAAGSLASGSRQVK